MAWPIVLDACVPVPGGLRDDLLSVASTGIFRATWSSEILDEVERNLGPNYGLSDEQVAHLLAEMRRAFPKAVVEGWQDRLAWVPDDVDAKDRHVVAAALAAEARVIVTANVKHFAGPILLDRTGIEIKRADDFLVDQWTMSPRRVAAGVRRQIARLDRTPDEHVERVTQRLPAYGAVLAADIELLRRTD